MRLAYIEHTGDYGAIPFETDVRRLYGWAKAKGIRPGFYPMGIFYDRPDRTAPEKRRSEVAIPIYGTAKPEGDVKVRNLPAMKVAAMSFRGPSREYPDAYRTLGAWVEKNGYEWAGPSIEVYAKRPETKAGETIVYARIKAPVKKK